MIVMGSSVRAVIAYGVVAIVILLVSYLLIVKPAMDDANDQIDRSFEQSEKIQKEAFDSAEEISKQAQRDAAQAQKQAAGAGN